MRRRPSRTASTTRTFAEPSPYFETYDDLREVVGVVADRGGPDDVDAAGEVDIVTARAQSGPADSDAPLGLFAGPGDVLRPFGPAVQAGRVAQHRRQGGGFPLLRGVGVFAVAEEKRAAAGRQVDVNAEVAVGLLLAVRPHVGDHAARVGADVGAAAAEIAVEVAAPGQVGAESGGVERQDTVLGIGVPQQAAPRQPVVPLRPQQGGSGLGVSGSEVRELGGEAGAHRAGPVQFGPEGDAGQRQVPGEDLAAEGVGGEVPVHRGHQ